MGLFELNYKVSDVLKFIIISIIGAMILFFINIYSVTKINNSYVRQNMAIVGVIQKNDPQLLSEVVPIITKGKIDNYENGETYLAKYSYGANLNAFENPITKDAVLSSYFVMLAFFIIITAIVFIYYFRRRINTMKNIDVLNKKAEGVIEGYVSYEDTNSFKEGSLETLRVQFSLMQNRIKASIDALQREKLNLKDIINDISHQFKTPIAAMTMYTDILKDADNMDKEDVEYFLGLTTEQVGRMDWLVRTLLKYARLESNVVEYKKQKQSLNETVLECVSNFEVQAYEKDLKLEFRGVKEVELYHDRKWMQEAIMNIIKNAIEHTQSGGEIIASVEESDMFVRVSIKDNGDGIGEEDILKIFERFHKGSNSVNPQSIGIGLSLSKSIIEGNGGNIKVKSKLDEGSEFIITFIKR